ncbi:MAG: Dihydroorotase [Bradyrhizobium sp.]|nr:Dihydroorotase [Bradyrhizobium sp.]
MTISETVDLVIDGGTIVTPDAEYRASIAIKDGLIHAIGVAEA